MPAFLNACCSVRPTRWSSPGSSWSSISTTVTWLPRRLKTLANSQPITPPPTMARLAGTSSMRSSSSLVMTRGSDQSKRPMRTGSEPLARITASPSSSPPSSSTVPSGRVAPGARARRPGPASVACPATTCTLRALSRWATPSRSCVVAASLRAMKAAKSSPTSPTCTPYSAARRASCRRAAPATIALVGMQPRLRQVPPISRASTTVTSAPSWAARPAAT